MSRRTRLIACGLLVAASSFGLAGTALATGIDFIIAQDGDVEAKLLFFRPDDVSEPYDLPLIPSGQFADYFASIEPGWDGLGVDQADAGRFALLGTNGVALQRVSFDDGFSMYTEEGDAILTQDGATHVFAGEAESDDFAWHQHLIFAVDPGTAPGTQVIATFRVTDPEGAQADSDDFTLTFQTSVPTSQECGDLGGTCGAAGMVSMLAIMLGLRQMRRR